MPVIPHTNFSFEFEFKTKTNIFLFARRIYSAHTSDGVNTETNYNNK